MLFTVINYLPLIEEEMSHSKKASSKKTDAKTEGSGEPEDETEAGPESVSTASHGLTWMSRTVSNHHYFHSFHHYDYLSEGCCTPPPEV
jgi:hypothetical protein